MSKEVLGLVGSGSMLFRGCHAASFLASLRSEAGMSLPPALVESMPS
jgi:hypothetical protein